MLAKKARVVALDRFDMRTTRQRFVRWLTNTVEQGKTNRLIMALRASESRLWQLQKQLAQKSSSIEAAADVRGGDRARVGELEHLGKKFGGIASSLRSRFTKSAG
jgi:hypothetical protein